ncbi:hypothetical protein [Solibacillus sp.]|uniref:hypothetical protein n=1 Tax=Solibacillus sp. TaxID=1909654 RepID=UPI00331513A6
MALVTLLEYLMNNCLRHNIIIGKDIALYDVYIAYYKINSKSYRIYTDRGDHITLDISKFRNFTFDATLYKPTNSIEMIQCLRILEKDIPYNAYIETADGTFIAGFYKIDRINQLK